MEDIASLPNSSRSLFGDAIAPEDVMPMVGRGAASRMFANGKLPEHDLTAVSQFFQPGATLSNCTAFARSSMAKSKTRARSPGTPPRTAAEEAGAEDEAPVNEMQFFNIGGARVPEPVGNYRCWSQMKINDWNTPEDWPVKKGTRSRSSAAATSDDE